jgi:hypothetical protein
MGCLIHQKPGHTHHLSLSFTHFQGLDKKGKKISSAYVWTLFFFKIFKRVIYIAREREIE